MLIILAIFIILNLNSSKTTFVQKLIEVNKKEIATSNTQLKDNLSKNISNTNNNKNTVTSEVQANDSFSLTLQKEELPADIANLPMINLGVPFFKQQYARSCEEASLRMVLAYYGIETDDMDIVKKVGYNPRPWDKKNNIWDDPNKMFVGYVDDPTKSGYGAFAPAIATSAQKYGHNAESYYQVTAQFIGQQISAGYPVIAWGFYAKPPFVKYSWKTDEGKTIVAYRGEHARVIVGVVGDPNNPTGFFLNDPLSDEGNEYWSADRLMTHMNMFNKLTNQVVVVE